MEQQRGLPIKNDDDPWVKPGTGNSRAPIRGHRHPSLPFQPFANLTNLQIYRPEKGRRITFLSFKIIPCVVKQMRGKKETAQNGFWQNGKMVMNFETRNERTHFGQWRLVSRLISCHREAVTGKYEKIVEIRNKIEPSSERSNPRICVSNHIETRISS